MKIDDEMRFPHPVLWAQTDDFATGEFSVALAIHEAPTTGQVQATCTVTLSQPELKTLVDAKSAHVGLYVTCLDTYYNELFTIEPTGGVVEIPPGLLRGKVTFRPMAWANEPVHSFMSASIHPEFGAGPFGFGAGVVLAIGEPNIISVGSDKLAPMGSIFNLAEEDTVPIDTFAVQPEDEKIQILVCSKTLEKVHTMRNTADGRPLLLNSVYLPVVMHILGVLKEDASIYEARRWCKVFKAKLDHLGIDVKHSDPLEVAQQLLKAPFGRINAETDVRSS